MNRWTKVIRNKIRSRRAFSIAEVLVAMLILLMVSSIVAAGIPAARSAYENVVITSNAEVLLSTTISALRNELGTAKDIENSDNQKSLKYYNEAYGTVSQISVDSTTGRIMLKMNAGTMFGGTESVDALGVSGGSEIQLVSDSASNKNLYATFSTISYDDNTGIVTITGIKIKRQDDNSAMPYAERETVSIRVI